MDATQHRIRHLLVLGGSEFIGRAIVDAVLTQCEGSWSVTMLNRGRRHWGDVNRYPGRVRHLIADRDDGEVFAAALRTATWDAIVDLSCFGLEGLQPILTYAEECAPHLMYIFISSDSVYEVCHLVPGVPPKEEHDQMVDASLDEYGAGKLMVENALRSSNVRSLCLRLPDVLGPFENTERFWAYYMWIQVSAAYPIFVSEKNLSKPLSFVYSCDVASFIAFILQLPQERPLHVSYNVSFEETLSLRHLICLLAQQAGFPDPTFTSEESDERFCNEFLPSVQFGALDSSAIRRDFPDFKFTPLAQAVRIMVDFFRDGWGRYPEEREEVLDEFPKGLRKRIRRVLGN